MATRRANLMLLVLLSVAVVGCDQLTKDLARSTLVPYVSHSYAGGFVELLLVENPGGLMSLGDSLPEEWRLLLFRVLVPVALLIFTLQLWRSSTRAIVIGMALVVGGGLGNWVDRLTPQAAVTDFLRIGVRPLQTGIFNFADVALVVGVVVLLVYSPAVAKASEEEVEIEEAAP